MDRAKKLSCCRLDKRFEQVTGGLLVCQPLGMPLNGKSKRMIGQLDRLDESVGRAPGHTQRGGNILQSLMMQAVDPDDRLSIDLCQARPFLDLDLMHQDRSLVTWVIMVKGIRELIGKMGIEASTERHVDDLAAAADAQKWFSIGGGGLDQVHLDGIPLYIYVIDARMGVAHEIFEANVASPRKENSIQMRVKSLPSLFRDQGRNQNWNATCLDDGIHVRLHEHDGWLPMLIVRLIGCNSDKRFHPLIVKQKKDPKG